VLRDKAASGQLENDLPIHLLVEIEIKGVEGLLRVAESGLLDASGEEAILAAQELVADEGRDEIDGWLLLRLRLQQARLQRVGHAGEPQLP